MMIIVSILSETGVFNWMGLWAFKISKGKVWPLLTILCLITALVSAVLDNVTTILLMTPIIIQLCETVNIGEIFTTFMFDLETLLLWCKFKTSICKTKDPLV
jgi:Na+/H+ antiporter NhaD/arsenite permease-like protein